MSPFLAARDGPRPYTSNRTLDSSEFNAQWTNPSGVFAVLLIVGSDVVSRALAQMTGGCVGLPSFSFGWVAYAVNVLSSAFGEGKLMPPPDCSIKVINGKSGYGRDNTSWILGRLVRDYEYWMHDDVRNMVCKLLDEATKNNKRPPQVGLCISVYKPQVGEGLRKMTDRTTHWCCLAVAAVQLGLAAVPCGLYLEWGVMLITVAGIFLSVVTATLPQWGKEKWGRRLLHRLPEPRPRNEAYKRVVLTRGNGSQHAIVVLGTEGFLDLEALASGQANVDVSTPSTRWWLAVFALLWILLLITATGLQANTWFLLLVGAIGIGQNIWLAGRRMKPAAFGVPLDIEPVHVYGNVKVMRALYEVEEDYPGLGRSMRDIFFPGELDPERGEVQMWLSYKEDERTAAVDAVGKKTDVQGSLADRVDHRLAVSKEIAAQHLAADRPDQRRADVDATSVRSEEPVGAGT
ncbi:hypothetical protein GP486_008407 [Trichoglossum hirsutum]|uniref:Uncharacterized protein n=1 Tax=Trichoglossum hirsutum TaxID=265104 RepID=A0A9P8L429_9PEZI|nr:hypothetical protein GP486_008407 [Trichoglossum hirsutum]